MSKKKGSVLGLCSAGSYLKISAWNGKKYFNFSRKYLNQDEVLLKKIKETVAKAGGSYRKISAICSVTGPGRFTGVRISYTFASVYGALSSVPVYGVTVFDCLAYNLYMEMGGLKSPDALIAAVSRAFKDEFYLRFYAVKKGRLAGISAPEWLKEDELTLKLKNFGGFIIGDAEEFPEIYSLFEKARFASLEISAILPENIIKSALYFGNKDIKPLYLKPAKYELLK